MVETSRIVVKVMFIDHDQDVHAAYNLKFSQRLRLHIYI